MMWVWSLAPLLMLLVALLAAFVIRNLGDRPLGSIGEGSVVDRDAVGVLKDRSVDLRRAIDAFEVDDTGTRSADQ